MKVYIGPYRKNRAVNVRIDKYDTWSLDHTLALIILPALKQYREHHHGSPMIEGFFDEKTGETLPGLHEAWDDIIDKMIFSFEYMLLEDNSDKVCTKEVEDLIQEGLYLFGKYYRNLWD